MESLLQKILAPLLVRKVEKNNEHIGYKLAFKRMPASYVQGWVAWPMTNIWKKFGLQIEAGSNHWTIGKSVNGTSSRFRRDMPEYQSWLGGYIVKRSVDKPWTFQDHFTLAIADQNSWLRSHGDPHPVTSIEGWEPAYRGEIASGGYTGQLYEFGCQTHSDVGKGNGRLWVWVEWLAIASLFNVSNPRLHSRGSGLRPRGRGSYEPLVLRGYIAVFALSPATSVVLYANGAIVPSAGGDRDTFDELKNELRSALEGCEIVKVDNTCGEYGK